MPKPKACRECKQEQPLGRFGRCKPCGMARMVLGFRWSGVFSRLTNRQVEKTLLTLEKRFGAGGEPRADPFVAGARVRWALRTKRS